MQKIDLTGIWRYEKDETNIGIDEKFYLRSLKHNGFVLPGSCCGNGIGRQQQAYDTMDKTLCERRASDMSILAFYGFREKLTYRSHLPERICICF